MNKYHCKLGWVYLPNEDQYQLTLLSPDGSEISYVNRSPSFTLTSEHLNKAVYGMNLKAGGWGLIVDGSYLSELWERIKQKDNTK